MRIGVPKEIKTQEFRVGMTPSGVATLVARGHKVFVEQNAGVGSSIPDANQVQRASYANSTLVNQASSLNAAADRDLVLAAAHARLIERATDIDWDWLGKPSAVGITAGASAPEVLVREVVDALRTHFDVTEEQADHTPERMIFKLPRELVA